MLALGSGGEEVHPGEILAAFAEKKGGSPADQLSRVSRLRLISSGGKLVDAEPPQLYQTIKIRLCYPQNALVSASPVWQPMTSGARLCRCVVRCRDCPDLSAPWQQTPARRRGLRC